MGQIDKKEIVAVGLLAVGILLFANPAYTQGQGGSAASVEVQQEIDPDALAPQTLSQINPDAEFLPVIEYEALDEDAQSIFDTGREGIYVIETEQDAEGAVLERAVFYEGETYLAQTEETAQGINLQYSSVDVETNIVGTNVMTEGQAEAFGNATADGEVTLTDRSRGLAAYEYVRDDGDATYYETSTETNNGTVLTVSEVDVRELVDPFFADTDEMTGERRDTVVSAIQGDSPVVTGETLNEVQQNQLVFHEGSYYQLGFAEASEPITEALGPLNFAGMALGILFVGAGGYMARRVYLEKT